MPSFIVKPNRDEDFYVLWSTVVDAPTAYGTRDELASLLRDEAAARFAQETAERFERADEFGTSMNDPQLSRDRQWFGWHDKAFALREWPIPDARHDENFYEVPRENVRALCELPEGADPTNLLIITPY